jgi:hypothetical protein
MTENRPF